jgi:5'-nucleotidase
MSIPAFAISQEIGRDSPVDFAAAGRFARVLAMEILRRGMPSDTLFNVNVPRRQPRGVHVTHQGRRIYPGGVIERVDPKGRTYYWIGGQAADWEDDPQSDFAALADGLISVTPLHLDMTNYKAMEPLRRWNLSL